MSRHLFFSGICGLALASSACVTIIKVESATDGASSEATEENGSSSTGVDEEPTEGNSVDYCALSNEQQKLPVYHDPDCPVVEGVKGPWVKDCDGECHLLVFLGGTCDEAGQDDPSANFNCAEFEDDCGACSNTCLPPTCPSGFCNPGEPGAPCVHPDFPEEGLVGIVGCDGTCYLHWGGDWATQNFDNAMWCDGFCDDGTKAIWNFKCDAFHYDGDACDSDIAPQAL